MPQTSDEMLFSKKKQILGQNSQLDTQVVQMQKTFTALLLEPAWGCAATVPLL